MQKTFISCTTYKCTCTLYNWKHNHFQNCVCLNWQGSHDKKVISIFQRASWVLGLKYWVFSWTMARVQLQEFNQVQNMSVLLTLIVHLLIVIKVEIGTVVLWRACAQIIVQTYLPRSTQVNCVHVYCLDSRLSATSRRSSGLSEAVQRQACALVCLPRSCNSCCGVRDGNKQLSSQNLWHVHCVCIAFWWRLSCMRSLCES